MPMLCSIIFPFPTRSYILVCQERAKLTAVLRKKADAYALAIEDLREGRELAASQHKPLLDKAQTALEECTAAQRQLNTHVAEHGCIARDKPLKRRKAAM